MKKVSVILSSIVIMLAMVTSCSKKEGCTDPLATNYDASAEQDDGSCIFPDPIPFPPDSLPSYLNPNLTYYSVTDIDGNIYPTIQIGTQIWMAENLRTSKYCNGDTIPNVTDNGQWSALRSGGWSYTKYNNADLGKLYNWYAVNDPRNICPCGWHVPSDAEWTVLIDYLGGSSDAGIKMKSTETQYWRPNADVTNESGFSALPAGFRYGSGNFYSGFPYYYDLAIWWSSSQFNAGKAWDRYLSSDDVSLNRTSDATSMRRGLSVRCVKD